MIKEFNFNDIKKYLEKENDTAILDAFDKLADVAIIFSPMIFGANFLPLLDLLDVKDRMVDVGRRIINFISSKQKTDYIQRAEQIKISYALITYTSYLEAFYQIVPNNTIKKLKKNFSDKNIISSTTLKNTDLLDINYNLPFSDHVTSLSETLSCLEKIYEKVSNGFIKLIEDSDVFNRDSKQLDEIRINFEIVVNTAKDIYIAQYMDLAKNFEDFGIYIQLLEFKSLYEQNKCNKDLIDLLLNTVNQIDVGMKNLHSFVEQLPQDFSSTQADDILEDIKIKYNAEIDKPIIENEEITSKEETFNLVFPKIKDAFIPQSYKSLAYTSKEIHLEDEELWNNKEPQENLAHYFIKYLSSPDSIEYPLIVLGHPGSGKSLLTKVLSAQLTSKMYTVIRIPLREVNPDLNIDLLVEEQIKKLTNRSLHEGYGGFAKHFKEKPLLIILDGYDELLQAKGDVFAGYLENARRFQQDQKELDRPVRIIVTSRITLIDKAIIPSNSPILRLLEFTPNQQTQWINIWNNANSKYFKSHSPEIKPFSLPKSRKGDKNSILELAEQPLLLLMLALYDSEDNGLVKLQNNLKRTVLYENLLRRFIRRERSRYISNFNILSPKEQNESIDLELKRLGVVAIGMYNRKKLCINTGELDSDLNAFELESNKNIEENRKLKDSESLLGGFFFIHQSTARDVSANSDNSDSAFEFLHNTFGEFLTADIILKYAVQEIGILKLYRTNPTLTTELNKKLNDPNGLCTQWFNCLMFTPLFSRPVVLEMIKEHIDDVIKDNNISKADFISCFKEIIQSQLKLIISTRRFPDVMMGERRDINIPLLGLVSIYTLNLIILASVLIDEGFIFDEAVYIRDDVSKSETAPWDKLAFLWRTWFSTENLMGLSVIFNAIRQDNKIHIKCHDKYESKSFKQSIDIQLSVSNTLAEHLIAGLSGLHTTNFTEIVMLNEKDIADFWEKRNSEIYFSFLIICLRRAKYNDLSGADYENINEILYRIINTINFKDVNSNTMLAFLEVVESCCSSNVIYISLKGELIKCLIQLLGDIRHRGDSEVARSLDRIIRLLGKGSMLFSADDELYGNRMLRYIDHYRLFDNIGLYDEFFYKNRRFHEKILYDSNSQSILYNILSRNYFNSSYNKKELYEIFSRMDFMELAECNPELISRALLWSSKDKKIINAYAEPFIELVIKYLDSEQIYCISYQTIINTIRLINITNLDKYMYPIEQFLRHHLTNNPPEQLAIMIISHPDFIIDLLKMKPELFAIGKRELEFLSDMIFGKRRINISSRSIYAYIKLLKQKFYDDNNFFDIIESLATRIFNNYSFENIYQYTIG